MDLVNNNVSIDNGSLIITNVPHLHKMVILGEAGERGRDKEGCGNSLYFLLNFSINCSKK